MDGYWLDWEIQEWCPDLRFKREQRNKILRKYLKELNNDEYFILSLNFGLDGFQTFSLEHISIILSVSREKIRQIKNEAIRKIRNMDKNEDLKEFLNEDPRPQLYISPMTLYS